MDSPKDDMATKSHVPGLEAVEGAVERTTPEAPQNEARQATLGIRAAMGEDEDSIYDTSMNGGSDDEDLGTMNGLERRPSPSTANYTADPQHDESRKRKSFSAGSDNAAEDDPSAAQLPKKPRLTLGSNEAHRQKSLPDDLSQLPSEVWHHVFTFCPPKTLGNLLRVNKLFHAYLDPSSSFPLSPSQSLTRSAVVMKKPNEIWKASRQVFWPQMPAQLRSMTELEIWRLVSSTRCQACNKEGSTRDPQEPRDIWHSGPGLEGVSVIWCFAIRACGPCLLQRVVKEIDLLLSSTVPSAIIPALPFVFTTQELHAVPASTFEQDHLPSDIKVTKIFLSSDVTELKQEFMSVKEKGLEPTKEWLNVLDARGAQRLSESSQWEAWERNGGCQEVKRNPWSIGLPVQQSQAQLPPPSMFSSLQSPVHHTDDIANDNAAHPSSALNDPGNFLPRPIPQPRQGRTLEEVAALKAARKAEIERRAALLDPPLPPNILRHIASFQAAIQIATPLTDDAWKVLEPRLLAQKADAERREAEIVEQTRIILASTEKQTVETTLATTREAREIVDKDWEDVQAPLRARIVAFADQLICDGWDNGKKVSMETAPRFAAEALIYIRKHFYAEVAKDAAAIRATGVEPKVDPLNGPFTQKLTLENMKWIFDSKLKPFTERFKKEIFFCNGCVGNTKAYGLEGVIQHYAAKHTSALSLGSVVVHWRSEWPEVPPFTPDGKISMIAHLPTGAEHLSSNAVSFPAPGFGAPQSLPGPPSHGQPYPPNAYGGHPEPYPSHPQFPEHSSYPPTASYSTHPYPSQSGLGPYGYYHEPPVQTGSYPPPTLGQPTQNYQPQVPFPAPPGPFITHTPNGPYSHGFSAHGSAAQTPYPITANAGLVDVHGKQLEDVAHDAREVWVALSAIKEIPGSVKVFVTIHHVVKRFRSRYSETPAFGIFIDGLSNNKDMRPVRNINALSCKACHFGLGNAAEVEEERSTFSLPQLVNHFQHKHVEPMQRANPHLPPLDWITDMVLLPDASVIAALQAAVRSDSQKHYLLSEAFPQLIGPFNAPAISYPVAGSAYQTHAAPTSNVPVSFIDNHDRSYGDQQPTSQADIVGYDPNQPWQASWPGLSAYENQTHSLQSASSQQPPGGRLSRENSHKKSVKNKNGRGKTSNGGGAAARLAKAEADKKAEEEEKQREEEIRAMWAADRAGTARAAHDSSAPPRVEQKSQATTKVHETRRLPEPAAPTRTEAYSSAPRDPPVRRIDSPREHRESFLMDALERHLQQGHTSALAGHVDRSLDRLRGQDVEPVGVTRGGHRSSEAYEAFPIDRGGQRPPAYEYHTSSHRADAARGTSPVPRHHPPGAIGYEREARARQSLSEREIWHSEPTSSTRSYHDDRIVQERITYRDPERFYEEPERHEEHVYDRPRPTRQEHYRAYADIPPPQERHQPAAVAYEIGQVIDAHGEYLIRRPVRQERVENQYPVEREQRLVRLEPERFVGYEPQPQSQHARQAPPPPRYETRGERQHEQGAWPAPPSRAEAVPYDAEYDPRYPAASAGPDPRRYR